jgi:membrane protease YdiL (CAAX protease family)
MSTLDEQPEAGPWILGTLGLALILWWIIFRWKPLNFWLEMPVASTTLALCSLFANRRHLSELFGWRGLYLPVGILSALLLYGIFWTGQAISSRILPFASGQVGTIYHDLGAGSPLVVGALLAVVIAPAEEIFWRGFLQRTLAHRLGPWQGWLWASLIYGALHSLSGNFMLTMAALAAGSFWGLVYLRYGSLAPTILSHSLWDPLILLFFPLR